MSEVREPAKIRYTKQLLDIVERELTDNQSMLRSAEVNIRRLQEERKNLLKALCEIESAMEVDEDPQKVTIPHIYSFKKVNKKWTI